MSDFSWKSKVNIKSDKISISSACKELSRMLDSCEWFYDAKVEGRNIVVYTHTMSPDILSSVPTILYGYQVLVHFAQFALCDEKYSAPELSSLAEELMSSNGIQ